MACGCLLACMQAYEGKSWLEVACMVGVQLMRQKVIGGAGDQVGLLFYGTVRGRAGQAGRSGRAASGCCW